MCLSFREKKSEWFFLATRTYDKDQHIDHKYLDRKYDMKGNLVQTSFSLLLEFF